MGAAASAGTCAGAGVGAGAARVRHSTGVGAWRKFPFSRQGSYEPCLLFALTNHLQGILHHKNLLALSEIAPATTPRTKTHRRLYPLRADMQL